ncbi:hypothetical protein C9374_003117 [Naegleria lovaniensis]|uniref:Uncharacterized protein n=1 Tax=Naegleria lovaniensis TaxID=51637 RepID=A0AA88GTG2_NAELO|nr:uncharacterized protein C9374_003117 [Naegleria lovaniensis]KAG2385968.1 hypothetical protein C9374_003117 [Naegleria lovaniensis]
MEISHSKLEILYDHFKTFLLNNSYLYWMYYISMISLCLILLIWSIWAGGKPHVTSGSTTQTVDTLFIVLEGIITIILILEILVRIFIFYNGNIMSYLFDDFINWFDLIVSIFCIVGFILYLVTSNRVEERIEEVIDSILITFRFLTQVLRIITLIRNQRKRRQEMLNENYIDLSTSNNNSTSNSNYSNSIETPMNLSNNFMIHSDQQPLMLNFLRDTSNDSDSENSQSFEEHLELMENSQRRDSSTSTTLNESV